MESGIAFMVIGVAVFFNFIILLYKIDRRRYVDAITDGALLFIISFLFAGSFGGLVVATVASALISLYLLRWPPKFPSRLYDHFM